METRKRPGWTEKYLRFAAWTQDEFRNLLCGLPPHPLDDTPLPADTPVPTRKEVADSFMREELRREDADRHIQDAIVAGHLNMQPPDERLLAKIKADLTPEEFEALRRAVAHDRSCSKAYRVARDAAIRWAAPRRDLFPDFPFTVEDLRPANNVPSSGVVSLELKERRRMLIKLALRERDLSSQIAFCRAHQAEGLTVDILRAVVTGDSRRADVAGRTRQVLDLLSITDAAWNTA